MTNRNDITMNKKPSVMLNLFQHLYFTVLPFKLMKTKISILILFILLLVSSDLFAGEVKVITADSALYKGIQLTIMNKYDEAMEYWDMIEKKGWSETDIYFCKGITIQSRMSEFQNYEKDGENFINIAQKCININRKKLKKEPLDVKSLYYMGSIMCFIGLYYAENKDWIKSAKYGMSGISNLERCISINSELKEPVLFMEIFRYYKYRLTKYVSFIPFIKDERKDAIRRIEAVLDIGFNKFIGRNQLAWILIDYGDFEKALKISLEGLKMFPGSRFYLWTAAESCKRKGNFKNAVVYLELIKNSLYNDGLTNEYTYAKCLFKLAECYKNLKEFSKTEKIYSEIQSLHFGKDQKIQSIITDIEHMMQNKLK